MFKRIVPILALALGAAACGDVFTAGAATVNGTSISKDQLEARVAALSPGAPQIDEQTRRAALTQLIEEELVRQAANQRDLSVGEEQVQERFDQARTFFPSEEQFRQRLTQLGFTEASFRAVLRDQLVREELAVSLGGDVTDEQVRQLYRAERERFAEYKVRHILLRVVDPAQDEAVRARAEQALQRIRGGEAFAAVARDISEDGTREQGGDLGFNSLDTFDLDFASAVSTAELRTPTGPIRTQFGYHLILVEAKRFAPLQAVADQIREQLRSQVTEQVIGEFLGDAVAKATVRINPLYGDWDAETGQIVPHESFVPASPAPDPLAPPGDLFQPPG